MRVGDWLRFRIGIAIIIGLLLAACGKPAGVAPPVYATLPATDLSEAQPQGKLPKDTHPLSYRLWLEVVPERPVFTGHVEISVGLDRPRETIWLHARGPKASRARVVRPDAAPLQGQLEQVSERGLSALRLEQPVGPGVVRIEIDFEAPFGERLAGLYRVQAEGDAYAFTQFEPQSAREAFPCFDEPRFKTPFDVTLRVKPAHVAVSNTAITRVQDLPSGLREVQFAQTQKLPTYLVAFAVGPLDRRVASPIPPNAVRAHPLPLSGLAVKGHGDELAYALQETPPMLEALERYFAIPYPYDKLDLIAVPDFAAGAMENAGAITFRDSLLLIGDDADEGQKRRFAYVNAHELAHQWFGNLVTMPWWDDIWLNEAFATWMGTRIVDQVYPQYGASRSELLFVHEAMQVDSRASARQIRQPIETDHDVDNAFDAITYAKGGAVLAMFERYLGAEAFQAGLRLYMQRHRFGSATAEDLVAALAEASDRPEVPAAFATFLEQPGVPRVQTELVCAEGRVTLDLRQSRYLPVGSSASGDPRWQIPFCVRYGQAGQAHEQCTLLTEPQSTLALTTAQCPSWVMPNAQAQGYYRWSLSPAALEPLVAQREALSTTEQMSVASNVMAALRASAMTPDAALPALFRLGESAPRTVLETVLEALSEVRVSLLAADSMVGYRARMEKMLRPYLDRLGLFPRPSAESDGERKLLRATVVRAMAFEAEEPAVLAELANLGKAELGMGEHPRLAQLPPELIGSALRAAVKIEGAPAIERVAERLFEERNGLVRSRLLAAVSANDDPALTDQVLSLSLHPRLRTNERVYPVFGQVSHPQTRDVAYGWLRANFGALTALLSGHGGAGALAAFGHFCSEERADEIARVFGPHAEKLMGGPRELQLAIESTRLCAAFAEAHAEAARAFFAQAATR